MFVLPRIFYFHSNFHYKNFLNSSPSPYFLLFVLKQCPLVEAALQGFTIETQVAFVSSLRFAYGKYVVSICVGLFTLLKFSFLEPSVPHFTFWTLKSTFNQSFLSTIIEWYFLNLLQILEVICILEWIYHGDGF